MIMITKEVRETINRWLDTLQDGDKIVVQGDYIILYNDCGCELDAVRVTPYND